MSVESIYQSVERVMARIEEIKRRFHVKSDYNESFDKKLKSEEKGISDDTKFKEDVSNKKGLEDIIHKASEEYRLPVSLIKAIIKQESGFNDKAISNKGALGLMQLMPETAAILGVEDPFNIEENIIGGSKYLRELIDRYGGNLKNALAAYNAGPNKVKDKIPDIDETKTFIKSVIDFYNNYSKYNDNEDF